MSELQMVVRFKLHDGKVEDFKRLIAQCIEVVRTKDSGTLQYELYFNADESEAVSLERFQNSEALMQHLDNLGGDLGGAIAATADVSVDTFGEPDDELRARLAGGVSNLFARFAAA